MKAVVYDRYGPPEVLRIVDIPKPIPKEGEVLIRIKASSVHRGDSRMRGLDIPVTGIVKLLARLYLGILKPRRRVLGMELSGIVESTGKNVSRFRVGDEVMASTIYSNFGGYAEYKAMKEDGLIAKKPPNLSFGEAAVLPNGGTTALGILKIAGIQKGSKMLIYGASGSVGAFSVQIAKHMGAVVTGVSSTANMELIASIGADKVIDYTKSDLSSIPERFDVVFDAVGKGDPKVLKGLLKNDGTYLNVHGSSDRIKKKNMPSLLRELNEMAGSGKLKPVVDRTFTLEEIVEAHRYVDKGHKKGNVALTIHSEGHR